MTCPITIAALALLALAACVFVAACVMEGRLVTDLHMTFDECGRAVPSDVATVWFATYTEDRRLVITDGTLYDCSYMGGDVLGDLWCTRYRPDARLAREYSWEWQARRAANSHNRWLRKREREEERKSWKSPGAPL